MYTQNVSAAKKKMTVTELTDFIFENYYNQIGLAKENRYYSMKHQKKDNLQLFGTKLTEKIPDPSNTKEYYNSYLKRRNAKPVKRSKIITQQPKHFKNPNIVDIKSVIIDYPVKTLHKLSKNIWQSEKVSLVGSGKISNSPLYSETKKVKNF